MYTRYSGWWLPSNAATAVHVCVDVLVLEFESHCCGTRKILNLFAKISNKDQLLRAPIVVRRNSTRIDS